MSVKNFDELLNAGCHFGHLTKKWNPKMAPYIFMEQNDIHIIDLNKTSVQLDKASAALKQIAKSGRKILFVATKKQAKEIVAGAIEHFAAYIASQTLANEVKAATQPMGDVMVDSEIDEESLKIAVTRL